MNARFSERDDRWIVEYFDAVPISSIAKDLKRSEGTVEKRAQHLKDTGAWATYEAIGQLELKAGLQSGRLDPDMLETVHGVTPDEVLALSI